MPIMDGSSMPFIEAIEQVGHRVARRQAPLYPRNQAGAHRAWRFLERIPSHDGMRFEVEIDFDTAADRPPEVGRRLSASPASSPELSRARTFGFMRDVERLWGPGIALGSSLENSVVISDDDTVINVEGLRYAKDEFVRHKTLDAVGDLALAGAVHRLLPFLPRRPQDECQCSEGVAQRSRRPTRSSRRLLRASVLHPAISSG
jgi:UDP-3-O-[3-hydroxymyristoyl] N-acetylglucosamine deacetylase